MRALLRLTGGDLRGLAAALCAGRLRAPFTALALRRYIDRTDAGGVARDLAALAGEGASAGALARFLEALAEARSSREAPAADLVWTGPKPPGAQSRDTAVVVRELFAAAGRSVLVAGYAVAQGREVFRVLAERMDARPELAVRLYLDVRRPYGDRRPGDAVLGAFARRFRSEEWPGRRLPELYYDPRSLDPVRRKRSSLHAKCVVVDSSAAFVSSANFTEAAQARNIEVGVLVRDAGFASRLEQHFGALARASFLVPVAGP